MWTLDVFMDQTRDGRRLKLLPVVDEVSRYCLAIRVGRRLTARDVMQGLERLMLRHGAPGATRCDNGPEFVAAAVRSFLAAAGVETLFIEPGAPWENGYGESFGSRSRDELLNLGVFSSRREAEVLIERYRREYNRWRPHSGLGYRTPTEFLESEAASVTATAPS